MMTRLHVTYLWELGLPQDTGKAIEILTLRASGELGSLEAICNLASF